MHATYLHKRVVSMAAINITVHSNLDAVWFDVPVEASKSCCITRFGSSTADFHGREVIVCLSNTGNVL